MKALIVGLGQIGLGYDLDLDCNNFVYSHSRALIENSSFNLVIGVDWEKNRRDKFVEIGGSSSYSSLEEIYKIEDPEFVVISSPTSSHKECIQKVLDLGSPKMILCEKPFTSSPEDGEDILKACEKKGVALFVNYIRRSDPSSIEIKNKIESGEYGHRFRGNFYYTKGFEHNASHILNLLEYWFGDCTNGVSLNKGRQYLSFGTEPTGFLEFGSAQFTFQPLWDEDYTHFAIEFFSDKGKLSYECGGQSICWRPVVNHPSFKSHKIVETLGKELVNEMNFYQRNVVNEVVNFFENKPFNLCPANEAIKTIRSIRLVTGE